LKKAQAARFGRAFDSGVDSDIPVTTATTDNLAARPCGDKMAELIRQIGEVAVIVHDGSRTGIDAATGS
jgi:ribose transport system substrate-binding protein